MFLYLETKKDRILKLAENVTDQQKKDINSAPFISLCLDESIDISKSAHLAVFARYCVGNIIKEELSAITTMLITTEFFSSDEALFWLNGYVNKQNCRIWSEANPQVYVETPLHPEKLTVWCALWAGGILLQKR
ncbi:general transcription factor II-I repeat domain-containing protein 2A [Trichonephila clavipes]|uniref:General transcription factor II-I repeat domain-containing protein 2A n=1 Tax=Trichonephila clavipes TaxID=2585209 RepID=A0A8X6T226_TRICX|nr:general transcription factor II-I repeat domain-containing protein 2A [Trichonephila clavipes]